MSNTIRILCVVVDTEQSVFYKEDATTIEIPQRDIRLAPLVREANRQISRQGFADLDFSMPPEAAKDHFNKVEANSNGFVKFYRVAIDKIKSFFGESIEVPEVEPQSIGLIPIEPSATPGPKEAINAAALEDIIKHATPSDHPDFHQGVEEQKPVVDEYGKTPSDKITEFTPKSKATHTIVAVVGETVIPGMEKMNAHFVRAAKLGSQKGVENFLERLSKVIVNRSHRIEDLLRFMERGDLPIADDGSIVIYKVLRNSGDHFVDCHTGNVKQRVGSFVCMDESLVDHNRNNECSNGLHIARRGYVSSFSGDVITICKLAPEDVIAVPSYDANKMRVCGYHIVHLLSEEHRQLLRANRPITETESGRVLLGQILAGKHIGKIEEVRITGQQGSGLKIKPYDTIQAKPVVVPTKVEQAPVAPADALPDRPDTPLQDAPIDPKEIEKEIIEERQLSKKEQAQAMYQALLDEKDLEKRKTLGQELLAFKKAAKKSWETLGIDPVDALEKLK